MSVRFKQSPSELLETVIITTTEMMTMPCPCGTGDLVLGRYVSAPKDPARRKLSEEKFPIYNVEPEAIEMIRSGIVFDYCTDRGSTSRTFADLELQTCSHCNGSGVRVPPGHVVIPFVALDAVASFGLFFGSNDPDTMAYGHEYFEKLSAIVNRMREAEIARDPEMARAALATVMTRSQARQNDPSTPFEPTGLALHRRYTDREAERSTPQITAEEIDRLSASTPSADSDSMDTPESTGVPEPLLDDRPTPQITDEEIDSLYHNR